MNHIERWTDVSISKIGHSAPITRKWHHITIPFPSNQTLSNLRTHNRCRGASADPEGLHQHMANKDHRRSERPSKHRASV